MPAEDASAARSGADRRDDQLGTPAAPPGEPQDEATEGEHPQPAGSELGVEAAGLAEQQVAVQGVERGLQGRSVEPRVEAAPDLRRVRVDVRGALDVLGQAGDVQDDARGASGIAGVHDRRQRALRVRGQGGGDLLVERPDRAGVRADEQLVGVDQVVEWGLKT